MTRRIESASIARHHLAWDSQPLVRSTDRRRGYGARAIAVAFLLGLVLGLLF